MRPTGEALRIDAGHQLSFAGAYHSALTQRPRLSEIISFDRDCDYVPGTRSVEP